MLFNIRSRVKGCQTGKYSVRNGLRGLLQTYLIKIVMFFSLLFFYWSQRSVLWGRSEFLSWHTNLQI